MAEQLLTMREAASWLRQEYGLERRAKAVWAWCYYGTQAGVRLEATRVGSRWYTSAEAIKRFMDSCAGRANVLAI